MNMMIQREREDDRDKRESTCADSMFAFALGDYTLESFMYVCLYRGRGGTELIRITRAYYLKKLLSLKSIYLFCVRQMFFSQL